jgi:predicted thioesterase
VAGQEELECELEHVVASSDAIHFMGPDVPPALSTPTLIRWMEMASHQAALPLLQPGQETVGIHVDMRHLAATPVDSKVRIRSNLIEQSGRILTFRVEAFDEHEKVGEATHRRAIVDVERFGQKLRQKIPAS